MYKALASWSGLLVIAGLWDNALWLWPRIKYSLMLLLVLEELKDLRDMKDSHWMQKLIDFLWSLTPSTHSIPSGVTFVIVEKKLNTTSISMFFCWETNTHQTSTTGLFSVSELSIFQTKISPHVVLTHNKHFNSFHVGTLLGIKLLSKHTHKKNSQPKIYRTTWFSTVRYDFLLEIHRLENPQLS